MKQHSSSDQFTKPRADYLRVATASLEVQIADVLANVTSIKTAYANAKSKGVELLALPELCLTAYSAADLFSNNHLLESAERGLAELATVTKSGPVAVIGAPLVHGGVLYNCAAVLSNGKVVGVVPKSYLANYNEFYEQRWFTSGKNIDNKTIDIAGKQIPFGTDLLFQINKSKIAIEICEDGWAPLPPAANAALAGANVIVNISASNENVGKTDYRRKHIVTGQAGRLICAYIYVSAGIGESVADVIYGGHQIIAENGRLLEEQAPHNSQKNFVVADLDIASLNHDRLVNKTFASQAAEAQLQNNYRILKLKSTVAGSGLLRDIRPLPFVPSSHDQRGKVCQEIFVNLSHALSRRIQDANAQALVLGLSGGLDSTLALLIAGGAAKIAGKQSNFVHTITMPGPASCESTQDNATILAKTYGSTHKIIPISDIAMDVLGRIGHDQTTEDLTYENTQARLRTLLLMNYSASVQGFVVGTGDMSENAIGWCTFNGDQMSMFNPNAQVPKTLVKYLIEWYKDNKADKPTAKVLTSIIATPISPELVGDGDLSQTTEDIVGPYELIDFFVYQLLRHGSQPNKIGYLATQTFKQYSPEVIATHLDDFLRRFTTSQWKRDVMPNGTKIGTVSLSPRGDLRMAPNTSPNWYRALDKP